MNFFAGHRGKCIRMACAGIWRRMREAYSSIRSFGIVGLDGNGLAGVAALLNESLGFFDVVLIGVRE